MEGEEENEEEEGEWRGRRTSSYCAACEPGYAGIHFLALLVQYLLTGTTVQILTSEALQQQWEEALQATALHARQASTREQA